MLLSGKAYGRAAWRYLVASTLFWGLLGFTWKSSPLWLLVLPVPFLWALGNRRRQTLYDLLAGTMLFVLREREHRTTEGNGQR